MLFLKFFIVLTFTCLQVFGHLKNLDKIGRCVHDAASNRFEGVNYWQYKYPEDISVKDEFGEIKYSNIVLQNILNYKHTSVIETTNSEGKYIIEFRIEWPAIYIDADAKGQYKDTPYIGQEVFIIEIWMYGKFEYQKPEKEKYGGKITNSDFWWQIDSLEVYFDPTVDRSFSLPMSRYQDILITKKSYIQEKVTDYVNEAWLSHPERIENLFKACNIDL